MNEMFESIFTADTAETAASLAIPQFTACIAAGLVIGGFLAFAYSFRSNHTKSFLLTMTMLPAIVAVVILMVNGNIGAGIAVTGAFSLVRFRSVPGTAKEISAIFLAMGCGLIVGMGYIGFAALFALILGVCMMAFTAAPFGRFSDSHKSLTMTIPEDVNYETEFQDIFDRYTTSCDLISARTTNMGSLFRLNYNITMAEGANEKSFIDALRTRNGNLEITLQKREENGYDL